MKEHHPNHQKELVKLRRLRGQLDGVMKMIDDKRYCPDILIQIKAITQSMRSIERSILNTHLEHCVTNVIKSKSNSDISEKINEITEIIKKFQ